MLDAHLPARGAWRMRLREAERSPVTSFGVIVGPKAHLVAIFVGIQGVNLPVVVMLAMNKGPEHSPWFRAQDFPEEFSFEIVVNFMARGVLDVFPGAGIAAAGG